MGIIFVIYPEINQSIKFEILNLTFMSSTETIQFRLGYNVSVDNISGR